MKATLTPIESNMLEKLKKGNIHRRDINGKSIATLGRLVKKNRAILIINMWRYNNHNA